MLRYFLLLCLPFYSAAETNYSKAKEAFESYVLYDNSPNSKIINEHLSQRVKDEFNETLGTATPEIIEILKTPFNKTYKKMEFVDVLENAERACLFYYVTYYENHDIFPGESLMIIFRMTYELGKWKYDGGHVNLTKKSHRKYCEEEILKDKLEEANY